MSLREIEKEQRFVRLYEAYADEIYQFIHVRSGFNLTVTEDITQDIFICILNGLDGFRGISSERTWIYRIAKNKLNDFYRRQYRSRIGTCDMIEAGLVCDPVQDIDDQIEKSLEVRRIRTCLARMPLHYKTALLMKYMDGKSVRQIAEIVNKSQKATESMLQRARETFIQTYQSSVKRGEI